MSLKKLFLINDLPQNIIKKILFVIIGLIIFIVECIILLNVPSEYFNIRKLISTLFTIISCYFLCTVIFLSFFQSIYLIKNIIFRILLPFIFSWGSFVLYLLLNRTFIAAILSLILAFIGYMFSGIIPEIRNKILLYFNLLFIWTFSRLFVIIYLITSLINIIRIIYKIIMK